MTRTGAKFLMKKRGKCIIFFRRGGLPSLMGFNEINKKTSDTSELWILIKKCVE